MYYMMNEPRKAMVFEFKVHKIDENKNKLLELIRDSSTEMKASDFTLAYEILDKSILDALDDAETFSWEKKNVKIVNFIIWCGLQIPLKNFWEEIQK